MLSFEKIVGDIKGLKVMGAENVALAAVKALSLCSKRSRAITKTNFIEDLEKAKKILFQTRPTEPCMRNALNYILADLDAGDAEQLRKKLSVRADQAVAHLKYAEHIIAKIGSRKIKNGMVVYTHCHSSTVINILKTAKKQGKKFSVHNTETRPLLQGRVTATELAKEKIQVVHYVDSAARMALKKADIMLIGADAITNEGKVINKIGSELFAEIANKFDVPVYVATDSWKFDPKSIFGFEEEIEKRGNKEVWVNPPKGVKIENFAFEKIDPDLIDGIISEIGIFKPEVFVEEVERNYSWMFI